MSVIKVITIAAVAFAALFAFPVTAQEASDFDTGSTSLVKSYFFDKWDIDITINSDGTFDVAEKQTFDFTGSYSYAFRGVLIKDLDVIQDLRVEDEAGRVLSGDEVEIYREGNEQKIKWYYSATDEQRTWTIKYKVIGGMRFFDDHDELYWNAVSAERDVAISEAAVTVHLPEEFSAADLQTRILSEGADPTSEVVDGRTVRFRDEDLGAFTDMTIVVGFPVGAIDRSPNVYQVFKIASGWFLVGFPILILVVMIFRWRKYGKDARGQGTIYARYEPPAGFTPAMVAYLRSEKYLPVNISASIIDLAARGYLKIVEKQEESKALGIFKSKSTEITLEKMGEVTDRFEPGRKLRGHEQKILDAIFGSGNKVKVSDLKNKFYRHIPGIVRAVKDEVLEMGMFREAPAKTIGKYVGIGVAIAGAAFVYLVVGPPEFGSGGFGVGVLIAGIIILIFARFMPQKTKEGSLALEHIEGFRDYLHTAERFRLKEVDPAKFEEYLSYATVLGVEKEWAARFADIYNQQPEWYQTYRPMGVAYAAGVGEAAAAPGAIASNLVSNLSSVSSSLTSAFAPTQSGSSGGWGGSGFSGGGFSGGGGGGGSSGAG